MTKPEYWVQEGPTSIFSNPIELHMSGQDCVEYFSVGGANPYRIDAGARHILGADRSGVSSQNRKNVQAVILRGESIPGHLTTERVIAEAKSLGLEDLYPSFVGPFCRQTDAGLFGGIVSTFERGLVLMHEPHSENKSRIQLYYDRSFSYCSVSTCLGVTTGDRPSNPWPRGRGFLFCRYL